MVPEPLVFCSEMVGPENGEEAVFSDLLPAASPSLEVFAAVLTAGHSSTWLAPFGILALPTLAVCRSFVFYGVFTLFCAWG